MIDTSPPNGFETNTSSFRKGRAGRPAEAGARYPSGKLKPVDKREGAPAPAILKRLFERSLRAVADPLCGSALGLLFVHQDITAAELAAGIAYAKLRGRYDCAIGAPRRSAASPDYGSARSATTGEAMAPDEVAAVKKRLTDTLATIDAGMRGAWCEEDGRGGFRWISPEGERARCRSQGERTIALLERVCVEDHRCERFEVDRLRQTLQSLVPWFGISAEGRA